MTSKNTSSFSLKGRQTHILHSHESGGSQSPERSSSPGSRPISAIGKAYNSLGLDVSYAPGQGSHQIGGRSSPKHGFRSLSSVWEVPETEEEDPELWEDIGVVEYLDRRLGPPDESTAEERVEALRIVLRETDLHEGDGEASDFLFHVARTKHGKIYIRVIRTLLLNRGRRDEKFNESKTCGFAVSLFRCFAKRTRPQISIRTHNHVFEL